MSAVIFFQLCFPVDNTLKSWADMVGVSVTIPSAHEYSQHVTINQSRTLPHVSHCPPYLAQESYSKLHPPLLPNKATRFAKEVNKFNVKFVLDEFIITKINQLKLCEWLLFPKNTALYINSCLLYLNVDIILLPTGRMFQTWNILISH